MPGEEKPVALLTDINGRTGSEQVPQMEAEWPRISSDETINTRGREILRECDTLSLYSQRHFTGNCVTGSLHLMTSWATNRRVND
jgi:hypothetical protein